jgi:hypothetical protein
MNGLKTLEVESSGYTSKIGNSFVLALEQNTTLETFDFYAEIGNSFGLNLVQNMTLEIFDFEAMRGDFKVMPQVKHLLALNHGGRRLLSATGRSAPLLNYWPRILARSSDNADVLFHFIREIPNVLVAKAGSWERKRVDHDETTSSM